MERKLMAKCAVAFCATALLCGSSYYVVEKQKTETQQAKMAKINNLGQQKTPKYKKSGVDNNQANLLIKNNFKTSNDWLSLINRNKPCFMLVMPNDNSFYETTKGVPDDDSLKEIISELKKTGIPMYAVTNNKINTVNDQIKNQQEQAQTKTVSPYMLIYFDSDNGKTTSTNLLSSVDTSRSLVVKNTKEWVNKVIK